MPSSNWPGSRWNSSSRPEFQVSLSPPGGGSLKQHIVRIALGLLVALVLVGHAAKLYQVGFITQLDNIIYDYRLRLTMPATVDDRIVILDIDERSIDPRALGHWPWGRDKITALLQKLFDKYGVLLVGIDVIFAEFIRGRPVVLGYYFSSEENAVESGALPEPVLPAGTFAGRAIAFTTWKGYGGVLPEFQASAANTGHTNPLVDPDGVSRRVPILEEFKGGDYETLSLALPRLYVSMHEPARNNTHILTP